MTPLFLALIMVEFVDVVFAIWCRRDLRHHDRPAIVYTSDIFAILGLRALYFALAAMVDRFHYLKYALAVLLVFIGSRSSSPTLGPGQRQPPVASPSVTFAILV